MASLIRSVRVPGERAFHEAVERGGNAWYGACLRITGNPAQAQDAVQEGLLRAWAKRAQYTGGARLETWIHRIAVNSALEQLRRRRPEVGDEVLADTCNDAPGPADTVASGELQVELETALEQLTALERACFVLKHLEQWRLAEIADELEVGIGSVKQALFRGVRKLRSQMSGLRSET